MPTQTNDDRTGDTAPLISGRRVLGALVLLGVPLAIVAECLSLTGYLPGDSMSVAWETPDDRSAAEHGNGAWLVGDTVVRSRFDAVTAFDAGSGTKRWEYVVPGRAEICAVSAVADDSVALIAHGEQGATGSIGVETGKGCATVAAIDLTNGRELWHTSRAPATDNVAAELDLVATGGGLAVLRDSDGSWQAALLEDSTRPGAHSLRAFDLRTGTPRWTAAVPKGCIPHRVAAARQVLAVLACDRTELKLAAFDPADGKERWTVPLGTRRVVGPDEGVAFLSADPVVVQVASMQAGGVRAFLVFGQDGRPEGQIEATGSYGEIPMDKPALVSIDGGRLVAVARSQGKGRPSERIVAFELAGGRELWRADPWGSTYDVLAVHAAGGRVSVLTQHWKYDGGMYNDQLNVFDAAMGDEKDERTFSDNVDGGKDELADLLTYKDLVIAVRWGDGVRPFSAYKRW